MVENNLGKINKFMSTRFKKKIHTYVRRETRKKKG